MSLCQNVYQPKTVVKAREQLRAANVLSLPRPFLYASVSFRFSCSCSSCIFLFLPSFSSHLPPSSSPPVPHPLRLSVKFLTFVTETRDLEWSAGCVHAIGRPVPETCGVFEPAGPPISPTSRPVAALKWGPSAECLCVCLPNPHKDLSLCHKFTESVNQMEHILRSTDGLS